MRISFRGVMPVLLFGCLFSSCQRTIDFSNNLENLSPPPAEAATNKCRLVFTNYGDGYFTDTYEYNAKGLVSDFKSVWFGSLAVHATMQYDAKGRLVAGTQSYDGADPVDVVFEYENNRIVKESYYETGTDNLVDLVINTFNLKGQLVKRDGPLYEIYCIFEYDAVGNCTMNEVRLYDGYFIFRNEFKYGNPAKDPSTVRPGMPPFNWWWINEVSSPNAPLEIDQYVDDGIGGEFKAYDEDPDKTIITTASQNLVGSRLTWDDAFGIEYYQYWEYENCGGKSVSSARGQKPARVLNQRSKDILLLRKPLIAGPLLKQQLAERKVIQERLNK